KETPREIGAFFFMPVIARSEATSNPAASAWLWIASEFTGRIRATRQSGNGVGYSSPCTFGISWVGLIAGVGFASPTAAVAGGAETLACANDGAGGGALACAGAGVVSTVVDCCAGSAGLDAIAGFGTGNGTARFAACGIGAGGRGAPRIIVG